MAAPAILDGQKGDNVRRLVTASAAAAALVLAGLLAGQALAQDKKMSKDAPKATMKVLQENAKVRAYEVTFAPGAENTSIPNSSVRVVRALAGGTIERTYADGKKEKVTYKTGQVRINEASPAYTGKNVGKSEIRLFVVQVK
jgi:hypothetical protein